MRALRLPSPFLSARGTAAALAGGCSVAILLLVAPAAFAGDAVFYGVGDLEGGDPTSIAFAVSPDGSLVVGTSSARDEREVFPGDIVDLGRAAAFRWTPSEGMSEVVGGVRARAATNSGDVIGEAPAYHVFRWSEAGGFEDLGDMGGFAAVRGASADGSVIVGSAVAPSGNEEAYRWSDADGVTYLGALPATNPQSRAEAVSGDGSVVVGNSNSKAFLWTAAGGMVKIDVSPLNAWALGISADGASVVGYTNSGSLGYVWTAEDGLTTIDAMLAHAASADGRIVVGGSEWAYPGTADAFIWDAVNGVRDLKDVLEQVYGLDLTGWTLKAALDVSDDGRTIVGAGIDPEGNQEGWVAVLPPQCDDGIDNDGDALIDAADPECGDPSWNDESVASPVATTTATRGCGIGFELAFVVPLLRRLRARRRSRG